MYPSDRGLKLGYPNRQTVPLQDAQRDGLAVDGQEWPE